MPFDLFNAQPQAPAEMESPEQNGAIESGWNDSLRASHRLAAVICAAMANRMARLATTEW